MLKGGGCVLKLILGSVADREYMITAHYLELGGYIVKGFHAKVISITKAASHYDAYTVFLRRWASNLHDAQRFYDPVHVIEITGPPAEFRISDIYGKMGRFPNPDMFTDEDYYW